MDTVKEAICTMYPYYRERGCGRWRSFSHALAWTRFAPMVTKARLIHRVLTDHEALRGYGKL